MVISYLLVCGIGNTLDINLIGWLSNSAFFKPSPIKYTLENNKSQRKYLYFLFVHFIKCTIKFIKS